MEASRQKTDWLAWAKEYASTNGGECLTDHQCKVEDRVCIRCGCGNVWETSIRVMKYSNTWCPICSRVNPQPRARTCECCSSPFIDDSKFNNKSYCSTFCQQKKWTLDNKEHVEKKRKEYHQQNKDRIIERVNKWQKENKDSTREHRRRYKAKNKPSLIERIKHNLRCRILDVLGGKIKTGSAVQDLGCSQEELKVYLESLFQPGMSWDNYGRDGWHIDHIRPLASFDLTDPKQFRQACYYKNLQPLWAEDNLKKRDKWEK